MKKYEISYFVDNIWNNEPEPYVYVMQGTSKTDVKARFMAIIPHAYGVEVMAV